MDRKLKCPYCGYTHENHKHTVEYEYFHKCEKCKKEIKVVEELAIVYHAYKPETFKCSDCGVEVIKKDKSTRCMNCIIKKYLK
jgi:peptide subunit release factor 1 (eRF1)